MVCHEMSSSNTIDETKQKHYEKTQIQKENVKFFWHGEELDNAMGLDDLKQRAGANNVSVEAREIMNIKVTMMSGNQDEFSMETTNTILDVKKKL